MKTLCSALLVFFLVGVSVARAQDKSPIQTFAAGLDSIRTALKIPGLAAALMTGDSVIFDNGFGYADLLNQIPVTPSTTFRVASITKTFTSTIIMQLVEQGTLDLQTPISKYGLDFGNPNIRVKHLLT
ncbi:MAG TPA: serine hydrolase domain-containing protein, partial [Chitinophagaceae bacterium]|nr:serine hydrolase domain-containing protein [Chitinophagaceae bacterium]